MFHLKILFPHFTHFPLFCFTLNFQCLLQLEHVVPLDKYSYDRNDPLLQALCINVHKTHWIETNKLFVSSRCVETLTSAVWSHSLTVRQDHIFKISGFAQTGLETLQICIKLISCVESSRQRLALWVRVKMTSIYSNNQIANIYGHADVSFNNKSFTCTHFWRSCYHNFTNFRKESFIDFCDSLKFCTGRTVQKKFGQVRNCLSTIEHINTFVVMKLDHFLYSLQCWDKVFVIVPAQNVFEWLHYFLLPHFLKVGIVFCSSRWSFTEYPIDQWRFCHQTITHQLLVAKIFF